MSLLSGRPRARRVCLGLAAVLTMTGALTSIGPAPHATASPRPAEADSSCFWVGPYTYQQEQFNYAYLDTNALYWSSQYTLPAGARLTLHGDYPHARYQSINAYDAASGVPYTALNDNQIQPDPGGRNPFLPGAQRNFPKRGWTVRLSPDAPPGDTSQQAPNTLYTAAASGKAVTLLYRVYVPDRGRDDTGGVGLPTPGLTLADGTHLTGTALCAALHTSSTALGPRVTPLPTYLANRDQPGKPATFPSDDPVVWHAPYTQAWVSACVYHDECTPNPPRAVGQFSNLDNAYVFAEANRGFGRVAVFKGTLPTTPATQDREPRMRSAQLRYWSFCSYENWSTRVDGPQNCLDDERVPTDAQGHYTIVMSRPEDRPDNATTACGVGWVAWPKDGDGAGHLDDALVMVRNMMPSPGFTQAAQDTTTSGDEARVMGPYLPSGSYTSTRGFEAGGCSARGHH